MKDEGAVCEKFSLFSKTPKKKKGFSSLIISDMGFKDFFQSFVKQKFTLH